MLDKYDFTALHVATANNQPEIVRKLLAHPDIEVNLKGGKNKLTPVMMATRRGKMQALEVIIGYDN